MSLIIPGQNGGSDTLASPEIITTPTGVIYRFTQSTKPTQRPSGPLGIGDRWKKSDDGTEWFWNGTYWLSTTINRYTSPYIIITAAGALAIPSSAPQRGFCESLRLNWSALSGGGANSWSSTSYFSVLVDVRNNDNALAVELGTAINTASTAGHGTVTPNVVWNYSDARVFGVFVTARVNDPINGQVQFFAAIRDYFP